MEKLVKRFVLAVQDDKGELENIFTGELDFGDHETVCCNYKILFESDNLTNVYNESEKHLKCYNENRITIIDTTLNVAIISENEFNFITQRRRKFHF